MEPEITSQTPAIKWAVHPEGADGLFKSGLTIYLRRAGDRTKAWMEPDGRKVGLELDAAGCSPERRLQAEARLVRAAEKTVMLADLMGCHPAEVREKHISGGLDWQAATREWHTANDW